MFSAEGTIANSPAFKRRETRLGNLLSPEGTTERQAMIGQQI
jgi:hypothetical protein